MSKTKKVLAGILLVAMMLSIVACNDGTTPSGGTTTSGDEASGTSTTTTTTENTPSSGAETSDSDPTGETGETSGTEQSQTEQTQTTTTKSKATTTKGTTKAKTTTTKGKATTTKAETTTTSTTKKTTTARKMVKFDIPLEPTQGAASYLPSNDYKLVWNDEFTTKNTNPDIGTELDLKKWTPKRTMGGSDIDMSIKPDNLRVRNGCLEQIVTYNGRATDGKYWVTTPSITTTNNMVFQYGYMEVRAKYPYETGFWPSFWLVTDARTSTAGYTMEIDVVEIMGDTNGYWPGLHKWPKSDQYEVWSPPWYGQRDYIWVFPDDQLADLPNTFHSYGFEWTPEGYYFSVDGDKYYTFEFDKHNNDSDKTVMGLKDGYHDPMYLYLENWLHTAGSQYPKQPYVTRRQLPKTTYIDYVRLYQKPGVGKLYAPEITETVYNYDYSDYWDF